MEYYNLASSNIFFWILLLSLIKRDLNFRCFGLSIYFGTKILKVIFIKLIKIYNDGKELTTEDQTNRMQRR